MAEPLDPNDLVTLEELAISNMGDLGFGGAAGTQGHPDQARSAGHDPGATDVRAHHHPAQVTNCEDATSSFVPQR